MLGRLRRPRQKQPPPLAILPRLPTAQGKRTASLGFAQAWHTPARPAPHPVMVEARARVLRLRQPRPLRLERGRLHRDHDHATTERATLAQVRRYVLDAVPLVLPPPSPWGRYAMGHALKRIEREIPSTEWAALWRVGDIRKNLDA